MTSAFCRRDSVVLSPRSSEPGWQRTTGTRGDTASRPRGAVTLVTLPHVTDTATMRKISFWRYLAVKRKTLFAALACALLVFSMLGCGTTNHLQSITLSVSNTNPNAGTGFTVHGGVPVPMYTWGIYSSGKQKLLYGTGLKYQILSTPFGVAETGIFGDPNATPPQTVQLSADGQLTPITPPACSFVDVAVSPATTPAFQTTGWYIVTATYGGQTTPPGSVLMATEGLPATTTNKTGQCGP
jgi:hypothetical protein